MRLSARAMRSGVIGLSFLAACAQSAPPGPAEPELPQTAEEATAADACGAARFRHLVGAPANAIDQASLPPGTRVLAPDAMITQDFSPQRLNIFTGTDGRVSSLRCF
jgi:hypothetical protein